MHMSVTRRLVAGSATALLGLAVVAGPAQAHFCYVNNMTPQAMAGASGSNGFVAFGVIAAQETGLCPAGLEVLADAAGVTMDTPINLHAVMAGGAAGQGKTVPGISHLDFGAIDAAFLDAVAACG